MGLKQIKLINTLMLLLIFFIFSACHAGKLLFHGAHFYTHQKFGVVDSGPFPWRGPHQTLQVLLPNLQQGLLLSLYEMRPLDISMLPLLQVVGTKFIGCFKKSANCHEPNP